VIVGAGASYDCWIEGGRSSDYRPPLAKEVFNCTPTFEAIQNQFQPALPAIARYRAMGEGASIEAYLNGLEGEGGISVRQAIWIRFYLQSLLMTISTSYLSGGGRAASMYSLLVDEIRRASPRFDRVIYINLNYDLLLDHAIEQVYTTPLWKPGFEGYIALQREKIFYIKPHGSVNWFVKYDNAVTREVEAAILKYLYEPHRIECNVQPPTMTYPTNFGSGSKHVLPAIVPPIAGKTHLLCPLEVLEPVQDVLNSCDRVSILTVGFSAADDDIRNLLSGVCPRVDRLAVIDPNCGSIADKLTSDRGINSAEKPYLLRKGFAALRGAEMVRLLSSLRE